MHGIVYVPESEAPSDPLEVEGASYVPTCALYVWLLETSAQSVGTRVAKQNVQHG